MTETTRRRRAKQPLPGDVASTNGAARDGRAQNDHSWTVRDMGPPCDSQRAGKGDPEAGAPGQPCRLRAGVRPGSDRHPRGAGGRSTAASHPAASPADGGIALRVLPGNAGGHGIRPRQRPANRHQRSGQRRRAPLELRTVRVARADAGVRRQRLRRDAAGSMGVGCQAAGRQRGHRRSRQRVQRGREPAGHHGYRGRLPRVDEPLCGDGPRRGALRDDHRGGHHRGVRSKGAVLGAWGLGPAKGPGSESSRKRDDTTGCAPSTRSQRSSMAGGSSATIRPC